MTTVHDLAADWSWVENHEGFILEGQTSIVWESATYGPRGGLRVSRLVPGHSGGLRQVNRYVDPETRAFLVEGYDPNATSDFEPFEVKCSKCGAVTEIVGPGRVDPCPTCHQGRQIFPLVVPLVHFLDLHDLTLPRVGRLVDIEEIPYMTKRGE